MIIYFLVPPAWTSRILDLIVLVIFTTCTVPVPLPFAYIDIIVIVEAVIPCVSIWYHAPPLKEEEYCISILYLPLLTSLIIIIIIITMNPPRFLESWMCFLLLVVAIHQHSQVTRSNKEVPLMSYEEEDG